MPVSSSARILNTPCQRSIPGRGPRRRMGNPCPSAGAARSHSASSHSADPTTTAARDIPSLDETLPFPPSLGSSLPTWSKSSPPKCVSPFVAFTSKTPLSMVKRVTSKVPPPEPSPDTTREDERQRSREKKGERGTKSRSVRRSFPWPQSNFPFPLNPALSLLCTQIEDQDILLPRLVPFIQPVGDGSRGRLVDDPFNFQPCDRACKKVPRRKIQK